MLSNHKLMCWLTDRSDKVNDAVDILLAPPGRDDERIVTCSSWAAGRGVWQLKAFHTLQVQGGAGRAGQKSIMSSVPSSRVVPLPSSSPGSAATAAWNSESVSEAKAGS